MKQKFIGTAMIFILYALSFLMTNCGQTSNTENPDNVQSRIVAVENGLLPQYYKTGTTPVGMSITDRMAHYYTPGVREMDQLFSPATQRVRSTA